MCPNPKIKSAQPNLHRRRKDNREIHAKATSKAIANKAENRRRPETNQCGSLEQHEAKQNKRITKIKPPEQNAKQSNNKKHFPRCKQC